MSIYTKTGDSGMTAKFGATRVSKDSLIIELIGEIDEFQSKIGLVYSNHEFIHTNQFEELWDLLRLISGELSKNVFITDLKLKDKITYFEQFIDDNMIELDHFVFFNTKIAAQINDARVTCRKVERYLVKYKTNGYIFDPIFLAFFNRLSDYLFVLSLFYRDKEEVL